MATKVKEAAGAVERLLLPRLNSIDGELKSINTRMEEMDKRMNIKFENVHSQMESVRSELRTQIGAVRSELRTEIGAVRSELSVEIGAVTKEVRGLSEKVDLVKDIEKLKMEVAELKRRR